MSFDMNPADDDPHLECANEIHRLENEVAWLRLLVLYVHHYAMPEVEKDNDGIPIRTPELEAELRQAVDQ